MSRVLRMVCVGWILSSLAFGQSPASKPLVQANFTSKADGVGGMWHLDGNGHIRNLQSGLTAGTLNAQVPNYGSQNVSWQTQMMTPDGSEYVFTGIIQYPLPTGLQNIAVQRSIKFESKHNTVRFVDTFSNSTGVPINLPLQVYVNLGRTGSAARTSSGGLITTFGNKDAGIAVAGLRNFGVTRLPGTTVTPTPASPGLIYYFGDARSKLRPTLQFQNSSQVVANFSLAIAPGKPLILVHGTAMRNMTGSEDARELAKMFAPMLSREWTSDIALDIRKQFANRGSSGSALDDGAGVNALLADVKTLAEQNSVEIGSQAILAMDESTQLTGTVRGDSLTVTTNFGKATVPLTDIAAISGGAGQGRPVRVFLRSGEILVGQVSGGLVLQDDGGLEVKLVAAQMRDLFLPQAPANSPTTSVLLLETRNGNRVTINPDVKFTGATAWGRIELSADNVSHLYPVRDPQPIHRVVFKDKSRLSVILQGTEFTAASPRFGQLSLSTGEITKFVTITPETKSESDPEADEKYAAHWRLTGENVLVGALDATQLTLITASGETNVDVKQIKMIEQKDSGGTNFSVELSGGNQLQGRPTETVWKIRSQGKVWNVPARHVVSYHAAVTPPAPAQPTTTSGTPNTGTPNTSTPNTGTPVTQPPAVGTPSAPRATPGSPVTPPRTLPAKPADDLFGDPAPLKPTTPATPAPQSPPEVKPQPTVSPPSTKPAADKPAADKPAADKPASTKLDDAVADLFGDLPAKATPPKTLVGEPAKPAPKTTDNPVKPSPPTSTTPAPAATKPDPEQPAPAKPATNTRKKTLPAAEPLDIVK